MNIPMSQTFWIINIVEQRVKFEFEREYIGRKFFVLEAYNVFGHNRIVIWKGFQFSVIKINYVIRAPSHAAVAA